MTLHKKYNTEAQAFAAFYGGKSGKNGQEEKLEIEEKPHAQDIYPTKSPSFSLLHRHQKNVPRCEVPHPSTHKIVPRKTTYLKWIIQIYSKPSLSLLKSNSQNHVSSSSSLPSPTPPPHSSATPSLGPRSIPTSHVVFPFFLKNKSSEHGSYLSYRNHGGGRPRRACG